MPSVAQLALGRMDVWALEELVLARGGDATVPGGAEEVLSAPAATPTWPTSSSATP